MPFVGAGISSWPGIPSYVRNLKPAVDHIGHHKPGRLKEVLRLVGDASDVIARGDKVKTLVASGFRGPGWPPAWFLKLCMLAILPVEDRTIAGELNLSELATFLSSHAITENDFWKLFYAFFNIQGDCVGRPTKLHELIVRLPCKYLITTNYDSGLEDASKKTPRPLEVIYNDDSLCQLNINGRRLFKLHGDLSVTQRGASFRPGIVLEARGYWTFPFGRVAIRNFVEALLPIFRVIFLGYSFGDANIHEMFRRAHQQQRDRPLLVHTYEPTKAEISIWDAREVDVIHVRDLELFLNDVVRKLAQPYERTSENLTGGTNDLWLLLSVQKLLDQIDGRKDWKRIARVLVEDHVTFSEEVARDLGIKIPTGGLRTLMDGVGCLRLVYPETDDDPAYFALNAEVRLALMQFLEEHHD